MTDQSDCWSLYILWCSDGTLYTGITNDLQRRVEQHNLGLGAKYTRGRGPVELAYWEPCADRSEASKREHAIKRMTSQQKLRLIQEAAGWNRSGPLGIPGL